MDYSDDLLESTPERVTRLLAGLGSAATVRTLMFAAGMTDNDILEGRKLLLDVLAAPRDSAAPSDTGEARAQRAATAELDDWDEPHFARYRAALRRHYPEVETYVFDDLSAATGTAAIQGVATFLARLDVLEEGSDLNRAGTKAVDQKAIGFLSQRDLDKAERTRLRGLIDIALGPTAALPEAPAGASGLQERRRESLIRLRDWFEDWSSTARGHQEARGSDPHRARQPQARAAQVGRAERVAAIALTTGLPSPDRRRRGFTAPAPDGGGRRGLCRSAPGWDNTGARPGAATRATTTAGSLGPEE